MTSTSATTCDRTSEELAGVCVLVVEDEYFQALDCCEWLRDAGAIVAGPVGDAADAKAILDLRRVDAAVVDINLGEGPDFQLASQLTDKGVPFVFATGYDEAVIPAEFQRARTLQKPFEPQNLIAAVRSASASTD